MAGASARRLAKELQEMEKKPLDWATAAPVGDNLYKWKASITGPVCIASYLVALKFSYLILFLRRTLPLLVALLSWNLRCLLSIPSRHPR